MKSRRKTRTFKATVIIAFGALSVMLPHCARVVPDWRGESQIKTIGDQIIPAQLNGVVVDYRNWRKFQSQKFNFSYPANWQVDVKENVAAIVGQANVRIRLQSVEQKVVLGALAPDDYYVRQNNTCSINTEKYADQFAAITVDIYENENFWSWPAFFNIAYPDVINYIDYPLAIRPELDTVSATRVSGIYAGNLRFFVKSNQPARLGDTIYDIALFCQENGQLAQSNCDNAKNILITFILNFAF